MSYSYTNTTTSTFTRTHAKHISAKVATDLKRMQRFYGKPSDTDIADYEIEIILLIMEGYLERIIYGFRRNGSFIEPTLRYTARYFEEGNTSDNDPGQIYPGADISNSSFYSYLVYSDKWWGLSINEKETFKRKLPFRRSGANEPGYNGYLKEDRTYSAGGRALCRACLRSY